MGRSPKGIPPQKEERQEAKEGEKEKQKKKAPDQVPILSSFYYRKNESIQGKINPPSTHQKGERTITVYPSIRLGEKKEALKGEKKGGEEPIQIFK